jgi:hypothetical protein
MKAVILAALMCVLYLVALTVGFRLSRGNTLRAQFMMRLFALTLPFGAAIHYLTPADLGFIPTPWHEPNQTLNLALFLFLYSATFLGGVLQLYNLADRGFSLRIVIDIDKSPDGYMTVDQVMKSYGAGSGIGWMYQKRIDDLTRLKFIEVRDGTIVATPAGRRVAARFSWLRRFLGVCA